MKTTSQMPLELANVTDSAILLNVSKKYRGEMSELELYEISRRCWLVAEQRCKKALFAMPVYQGVIREVYAIESWHPANSTHPLSIDPALKIDKRLEFIGRIAPSEIRGRYIMRSVAHLFPVGAQNPVRYCNV